jgi:hypothetical protein
MSSSSPRYSRFLITSALEKLSGSRKRCAMWPCRLDVVKESTVLYDTGTISAEGAIHEACYRRSIACLVRFAR